LVEDHTIGFFEREGVVTEPQEWGEEGDQYIRGDTIDCFPDRVRDGVRPGGRGGYASQES